ncbi:hypothetical protein D3C84_1222670 [compost metagenome]
MQPVPAVISQAFYTGVTFMAGENGLKHHMVSHLEETTRRALCNEATPFMTEYAVGL